MVSCQVGFYDVLYNPKGAENVCRDCEMPVVLGRFDRFFACSEEDQAGRKDAHSNQEQEAVISCSELSPLTQKERI